MLVTRETDYAVRTVLHLARNPGTMASVTDIAGAMQIPRTFLAKIVQRLARRRILKSVRGSRGGFRLARPAARITLFEIMDAIQGPAPINDCAVDSRRCAFSSRCVVHPVWVDLRKQVESRLKRETIAKFLRSC